MIAHLGRIDALGLSLIMSVRHFTSAAEAHAKVLEENAEDEARQAGQDERPFSEAQKLRAMWEYSNSQARYFKINTYNTEFESLGAHTVQLLLVGVYQQMEAFLNGLRKELELMGQEWPPRGNNTPLRDYTMHHLPGGLSDNKIKIGEERYKLFDYYRLLRNAFVHTTIARTRLGTCFDRVSDLRKVVKLEYDLNAPNRFEVLPYDDYLLFTRLVKYIAVDLCRIAEPSDGELIKLIEWKGSAVGQPLAFFLGARSSGAIDSENVIMVLLTV